MINRSYADIGTGPKPLSLHKQLVMSGEPWGGWLTQAIPFALYIRHATSVSASTSQSSRVAHLYIKQPCKSTYPE